MQLQLWERKFEPPILVCFITAEKRSPKSIINLIQQCAPKQTFSPSVKTNVAPLVTIL